MSAEVQTAWYCVTPVSSPPATSGGGGGTGRSGCRGSSACPPPPTASRTAWEHRAGLMRCALGYHYTEHLHRNRLEHFSGAHLQLLTRGSEALEIRDWHARRRRHHRSTVRHVRHEHRRACRRRARRGQVAAGLHPAVPSSALRTARVHRCRRQSLKVLHTLAGWASLGTTVADRVPGGGVCRRLGLLRHLGLVLRLDLFLPAAAVQFFKPCHALCKRCLTRPERTHLGANQLDMVG
jgi:hypothetical protein